MLLPVRRFRALIARALGAALAALCLSVAARGATAADFAFRTYTDGLGSTPFRLLTPRNYTPAARYPLVIFLHGAGEQGTNNTAQLGNNANGALVFVQGPGGSGDTTYETTYPCFMIAPQSVGDWSQPVRQTHVRAIVDGLIAEFSIDPDRIYITGLSMGGAGTWNQLAANPTRYAAAVPICGWGSGNYAAFKQVPTWVFHSADDGTVGVAGSDDAVNALRNNGGDPIYSRYATGGHSSWVEAYKNPHLVPWVMAQRRGTKPAFNPALRIASISHDAAAGFAGWTSPPALVSNIVWVRTDLGSGTGSAASPGVVTGSTNWSAASLALRTGRNTFRIQATGTSFSALNGGVTTFSDTVAFDHVAPAGDTLAPALALVTPTSAATFTTASQPLSVTGTASDNAAVTSVTWSNDRTALNGNATGTASWSTPAIALLNGPNQLTVTGRDAAGNTAIRILLVTYTGPSPNLPPVVQAGADTSVTLPGTIALNGSVYDDGLPAGGSLTTLWTVVSGPGAVVFADALAPITTASFSAPGAYVLRLTGGDGAATASDDLTVSVNPVGTLRIRFDFGDPSTPTAGSWNNISAIAAGTEVASAIDSTGAATGIRARIGAAFTNLGSAGLIGSPLFPDSASRDYFFVQNSAAGRIEFTGLRIDRRYSFVFYASRADPGDGVSRVTNYTIGSSTVVLDPVGNTTQTAAIANLTPDSSGRLDAVIRAQTPSNGYGLLGVIELLAAPATPAFSAWIASYFPAEVGNPLITGSDADPDRDGLSNQLEYVLALRPDRPGAAPAPAALTDTGTGQRHLAVTFRRLTAASGATAIAEASNDLVSWSASATDVAMVGTPLMEADGLTEIVTYRCVRSIAEAPRQFLRIRTTLP